MGFMGHFLNNLFQKNNVNIKLVTYGIYPTGNDKGFIECVSNVCSAREYDFKNLKCSKDFLASLAGACLIGWVLGIRDRHQDNQLILTKGRKTLLMAIDFGFLFNTGPMIDCPRISFTNRMLEVMKSKNVIHQFINLTVRGFGVIYDNQDIIHCLGQYLFPSDFDSYFKNKTFVHLERSKAISSFKSKLEQKCSGKSLKHTLKDVAHNYKLSKS